MLLALAQVALADEPVVTAPLPVDAITGRGRHVWGEAPGRGMVRIGGNGEGRLHYRDPDDDRLLGHGLADAVSYEYVDDRLASIVLVFSSEMEATRALAELEGRHGPPTSTSDFTRVWRGETVRIVYKQLATDRWIAWYAWLPLHGDVSEEAAVPGAPAPRAPSSAGP